jgi:hypothetical protein
MSLFGATTLGMTTFRITIPNATLRTAYLSIKVVTLSVIVSLCFMVRFTIMNGIALNVLAPSGPNVIKLFTSVIYEFS